MTYVTSTTAKHSNIATVCNVAIAVIVATVLFAFQTGAAQLLERITR